MLDRYRGDGHLPANIQGLRPKAGGKTPGVGPSHPLDRWRIAQAGEFIRALRVHLAEMNSKLTWIERQDVTASNARAYALRAEATTLRRDIEEARSLIDRLQRCYLPRGADQRR